MLQNAIRICDAQFGNIYRWDGEAFHALASHNTPAAFAEARERISLRPLPKDPLARMIAAKQTVHTADRAASEDYAECEPLAVAAVELGGIRTLLCVPLLKDNELIGDFHFGPTRSSPLCRQTDRTCGELRCSGGYRHRECATAERTTSAHH